MEGIELNGTDQESRKELSSGLVALAESGFGVVLILMTLRLTPNLDGFLLPVFVFYIVILLYVGIRAVLSETPQWSKNAKRLNGIGTTVMFAETAIGAITDNLGLGVLTIVSGMILTLVSTLHPNSRIRKTTSM